MASASLSGGDFEQFGAKIYSTVSKNSNDQNVFLSPASIALALAMCAAGAQERTLQQMLGTLGASSVAQLTATAEQVMHVFSLAAEDKQIQLRLANRLYAQQSYTLRQDYLRLVQKSFQADVKLEDFVRAGPQAVQKINAWVEEQTNKLIRNLLSPDDVSPDTRLILVNCIYFKVSRSHLASIHEDCLSFLGYMGEAIQRACDRSERWFLWSERSGFENQIDAPEGEVCLPRK